MARPVSGSEHVPAARALLRSAKTADQLRLAQSVLLPLEHGLTIEQTAAAIGRSRGVTCGMRTRFARVAEGKQAAPRSKKDLRNRASADLERERQVLDEVLVGVNAAPVVNIARLKPAIEAKLGKKVVLSSIYRMLARHGWRKLVPDDRRHHDHPHVPAGWHETTTATWVKQ